MNTTSWPILFGILAVVGAAFWYDGANATARTSSSVATSANAASANAAARGR